MIRKFKKIIYFVILIFLFAKCFEIVFFGKTINTVAENEEKELISVYKEFDYGDYSKIKLLHTQSRRYRRNRIR